MQPPEGSRHEKRVFGVPGEFDDVRQQPTPDRARPIEGSS
jgi:hypothetical protein